MGVTRVQRTMWEGEDGRQWVGSRCGWDAARDGSCGSGPLAVGEGCNV